MKKILIIISSLFIFSILFSSNVFGKYIIEKDICLAKLNFDREKPTLSIEYLDISTNSFTIKMKGKDNTNVLEYEYYLDDKYWFYDEGEDAFERYFWDLTHKTKYKLKVIARDKAGNETIFYKDIITKELKPSKVTFEVLDWVNDVLSPVGPYKFGTYMHNTIYMEILPNESNFNAITTYDMENINYSEKDINSDHAFIGYDGETKIKLKTTDGINTVYSYYDNLLVDFNRPIILINGSKEPIIDVKTNIGGQFKIVFEAYDTTSHARFKESVNQKTFELTDTYLKLVSYKKISDSKIEVIYQAPNTPEPLSEGHNIAKEIVIDQAGNIDYDTRGISFLWTNE